MNLTKIAISQHTHFCHSTPSSPVLTMPIFLGNHHLPQERLPCPRARSGFPALTAAPGTPQELSHKGVMWRPSPALDLPKLSRPWPSSPTASSSCCSPAGAVSWKGSVGLIQPHGEGCAGVFTALCSLPPGTHICPCCVWKRGGK